MCSLFGYNFAQSWFNVFIYQFMTGMLYGSFELQLQYELSSRKGRTNTNATEIATLNENSALDEQKCDESQKWTWAKLESRYFWNLPQENVRVQLDKLILRGLKVDDSAPLQTRLFCFRETSKIRLTYSLWKSNGVLKHSSPTDASKHSIPDCWTLATIVPIPESLIQVF